MRLGIALGQHRARHGGGHGHVHAQRALVKQVFRFALDQCRVQLALAEGFGGQHAAQELHVGLQADDVGLRQRGVELAQRFFSRVSPQTMSLAIIGS